MQAGSRKSEFFRNKKPVVEPVETTIQGVGSQKSEVF